MPDLFAGSWPLNIVGNERRFPSMARCAIDSLRDGLDVTLHHWFGRMPCEFTLNAQTQGLMLERRGLRVRQGSRGLDLRWSDVFMVQTPELRYLDQHRLYELPKTVAAEILAEDVPNSRDSWELLDALRRAMAARPWGFDRTHRSPMSWECPQRIADTEAKLMMVEAWDRDDTTPVSVYNGYLVQRATTKPTPEETEAFLAAEREHLGVDRVAGTVSPWR